MKYYLGIDLGGTNIAAGVVDEEYRIIAQHSLPTGAQRPFETVVADMARAAREVVQKAGMELSAFTSIGIGTPSCINPHTGLLVFANNMGWHNVPLREEFQKHINLPLWIKNDADCAALGEALAGAARDCENALMFTLGTGVGGGIILNKKIFSGGDGMGGELGHTILVYDGVPCTCGMKGCFESYGSATALINQAREAAAAHPESALNTHCGGDLEKMSGRVVFDSAREGDTTARAVVEQYTSYVAAGMASFVTIFRPDIVMVGGGISNAGELLLGPLNQKLGQYTFSAGEVGVPPIVRATLGNEAGIIGAALLEQQG